MNPLPRTHSPCISVCRMDEGTGLCEGCLRTLDEIAAWSLLDAFEREAVWQELDVRRADREARRAAAPNPAKPPPGVHR